MQNNPEIEHIIEISVNIAKSFKHQYVMTEHMLLSMLRHPPFRKTLEKFGVDVTVFESE